MISAQQGVALFVATLAIGCGVAMLSDRRLRRELSPLGCIIVGFLMTVVLVLTWWTFHG